MKSPSTFISLLSTLARPIYSYNELAIAIAADSRQQVLLNGDHGFGCNEPFHPTPQHILPEKKPFYVNETDNYYQRFHNGSENGFYRRSSCPAINILANRGYINRSGRNVTYSELAHAVRQVWNFGDDNVSSWRSLFLVL